MTTAASTHDRDTRTRSGNDTDRPVEALTATQTAPLTRPTGQSPPVGLSGGSCGLGDGPGGSPGVRPGVGLDTDPHTDPMARTTGQVRNPTALCRDDATNPCRVSPQGNIPLSAPSRRGPAGGLSVIGRVSSTRGRQE
jgi:hypothetical protein